MIWLAIISLLVGAVLAQRFKVMALVPASTMVLAAAVGAGVVQAETAPWIFLMAVAGISSMQLGYVIGLGVRFLLEAAMSEAPRSYEPGAASTRHPAQQH